MAENVRYDRKVSFRIFCMTHQEFLSTFTKHLYVGGTKRNELIHELETHLEELAPSESPVVKIGNPRHLARRYNSEHLGLLGSIGFMYSLPIVAVLLAMSWLVVQNDVVIGVLWMLIITFILIAPVWVSIRVLQMHQAKRKIFLFLLVTPLIATLTVTVIAFIASLYNVRYGWVGSFFGGQPIDPPEGIGFQWWENILTAFNIVWLGYFFSLVIFLMTSGIQKLSTRGISIFPKKKK